ncbi:hypothetical protein CHU92_10010 [Flavobacterium cyanobacteriorum]|uniref:Lipocalin-like domain-containing protein n=2 Tax=Flavobacterium cyanobacteriorum TaxID=2022802 RepID=A0A255Z5Z9_9FLAO|nr:hypothetical protein CHU92_10010 [Flavobacterium cyanobacteriorum]
MALCLTTISYAQKINQKELQGKWNVAGFNSSGISVDVKNGEVTLSPEMQAQLSPEAVTGLKAGMAEAVTQLKASFITFSGQNLTVAIGSSNQTGTYTIGDKDGKQVINFKKADGTTSEFPVAIKDKNLYITFVDQGQQADFIFNKS